MLLLLPSASHADDQHPLGWLTGCWSSAGGNAVEVWRVDGDDMVGFAVTVDAGRVRSYETLSIRKRDGRYVYTAWPSTQRRTDFTAAETGDASARFTNPAHDFPQVIAYRREGDALHATISMIDGTRSMRFDKVRCEAVSD